MGTKVDGRETKAFALRGVKMLNDAAGVGEGYVAVFGNLDGNGDVIDRGAFTKTLREARETKAREGSDFLFPLLWQHQEKEPIGGITDATEDENGLFIRFQFDMDIPQGQRAYSGAKKGYIRGLSIGYDPVKAVFKSGSRHLTEIRLWEGSPVTFPANDQAQITGVKARAVSDDSGDDIADGEITIVIDFDTTPAEEKKACGRTSWPLAARDATWDKGSAHARLIEWAGGKDKLSASKMRQVHFWYDPSAPDKITSYKFPFCDVINGEVKAVPHAIENGAARLSNSKIDDKSGVQAKMGTYYRKMAEEFKDPSIVAPWDTKKAIVRSIMEAKQSGGPLTMIPSLAHSLDDSADCDGVKLEALANIFGMSVDGSQAPDPDPMAAALLGQVDGLEAAINGVISAWQDWDSQTDALLDILGEPDDDMNDMPYYYGGYMSDLRSALMELKAGRKISAATRDALMTHVNAMKESTKAMEGVIMGGAEMENRADYGDIIASGKPNNPGAKSQQRSTGSKPGNGTTSSTADSEPGNPTLNEIVDGLLLQRMGRELSEK